jgi:hypothetical protein
MSGKKEKFKAETGASPARWVQHYRKQGMSWREVAEAVSVIIDEDVSPTAVRKWTGSS